MIRAALGQMPKGERLKKIQKSKNYKNNVFVNTSHTPALNQNFTYIDLIKSYIDISKNTKPTFLSTQKKIDLKNIISDKPIIIWFGHSSYIIYLEGKVILVDPVLSKNASPVWFIGKSFVGTNIYTADDFPEIDLLIITHDHYDHLDYPTVTQLRPKVKNVITGLGVGQHFEYWGYDKDIIIELDRREDIKIGDFCITSTPTRHFSGRNISRNTSLWCSFVLKSEYFQIYIGGDSGYDDHFKTIGEKFGYFDLAILECGQYNYMRNNIHMMPEEVVQAAIDLNAKLLLPVHRSKFCLAMHPRNEPIKRVTTEAERLGVDYITPMISEKITLGENLPNKIRREDHKI